ncbi:MAG: protoheme IX farnesyltransferase [Candidatus Marinimicrobia bacterium]|nr:protoheme IX farnesyltransferase [Candidatus Neomarinimicrobiota bacterium]|tara:strand:- start:1117 stop:2055 length:939 start_codon:yes stop_codon:yes gene_type:complete
MHFTCSYYTIKQTERSKLLKIKKEIAKSRLSIYAELSKLNILSLVLIATILGYYLGTSGLISWKRLFITLLGTALTASGSGALNHYLERETDKFMVRTKNRPLPAGLIKPAEVMNYGVLMVLAGIMILVIQVNMLTGFIALLTAFLYIVVYTPLKKITWLNTSIGSIPGALPILGGWTASSGSIDAMAWVLFAIMYLWQHPHFYSIAWICRSDYAEAKLKMLPVIEPDGNSTIRQIFWHLLLMMPITFLPFIQGTLGLFYMIGAFMITSAFFVSALPLAWNRSDKSALLLLKASVFYLPSLLLIIIIDKGVL